MEPIQTFEGHEVRQLLVGEDGVLETAFSLIDAHLWSHLPMSQEMDTLRDQVFELTGRRETSHDVRRALQEAKRKISDVLRLQSA